MLCTVLFEERQRVRCSADLAWGRENGKNGEHGKNRKNTKKSKKSKKSREVSPAYGVACIGAHDLTIGCKRWRS